MYGGIKMEIKNENLKVGDTVFLMESISVGWSSQKSFYIPVTIDRVTKTQVIIKNKKFNKVNQREVGGGYRRCRFFLLGEKYGQSIVKDETNEMNEFKSKKRLLNKLNNLIDEIPKPHIGDDINKLKKAEIKTNELIEILGEK